LPLNPLFGSRLQCQWLSADICVKAIHISTCLSQTLSIPLDAGNFNRAMSRSKMWGQAMHCYDGTNATGVWRVKYNLQYYYMSTDPGEQVVYPRNMGKAWAQQIHDREVNLLRRTRSMDEAALEESEFPPAKLPNPMPEPHMPVTANLPPLSHQLAEQSYWDSPESRKLFGASDDDHNTLVTIKHKIEILRSINQKVDGYRMVVEGRDPRDVCTQLQIFEIRQRCALLCMAYINAHDKMKDVTWLDCCRFACKHMNVVGIEQTVDCNIIEQWNIAFRQHEYFPHPNPLVALGKMQEPPIFEMYPDMKDLIRTYCLTNLVNLTVEKVQEFIQSIAVPECI